MVQTYAASQVLAYLNSIAAMSEAALQRLVVRAVEAFSYYADEHLFSAVQCRGEPSQPKPRLELLLAVDGSWSRQYTANFLA